MSKNKAKKGKPSKQRQVVNKKWFSVKTPTGRTLRLACLIIGDVVIYPDYREYGANQKHARKIEKSLDVLVAAHIGSRSMDYITEVL